MFATLIIGLIVLIGLLAAVGRIRSKRPTRLIETAPNAAVSLGIFATFVGVYVGLLGFDVHDISASIPILLDGLKTAFMTSIWGLAVSIVLRFLFSRMDDVEDDGVVRSDEPGLRDREEQAAARLEAVREEIRKTREAMVSAFTGFSDQMAEMGVDALVQALGEVIRDFNTLLSDLVGSAFRDMSTTMARLIEWQENYRRDMETMRERVETVLGQTDAAARVFEGEWTKRI